MKNYYLKNQSDIMLIINQHGILVHHDEFEIMGRLFRYNCIESYNGSINGKSISYNKYICKLNVIEYKNNLIHGKEIHLFSSGEIFQEKTYSYGKIIE